MGISVTYGEPDDEWDFTDAPKWTKVEVDSLLEAVQLKTSLEERGIFNIQIRNENNDSFVGKEALKAKLTIEISFSSEDDAQTAIAAISSDLEKNLIELAKASYPDTLYNFSIKDEIIPDPLNTAEMVAFIKQRLSAGDIPKADIPLKLIQYGLIEPTTFINKLREWMIVSQGI
ncbi:dihydropteroate synthase [Novimethylophilus kurashikiensis]|uniref:Dihydropteroate synthase n=1 Tax=Novimethylophilus kurashikiensis TaxID=1825523 RepID=A0A2R5FC92_9PROT|nr:hypothetical protein [Novimethylophilus kurashikiensis]GBG14553.1 dihydropteroate synthase [Novimethylophilus kurashikiensis]